MEKVAEMVGVLGEDAAGVFGLQVLTPQAEQLRGAIDHRHQHFGQLVAVQPVGLGTVVFRGRVVGVTVLLLRFLGFRFWLEWLWLRVIR